MLDLKLKLWHQVERKLYDVVNIDLMGTIRKVKVLDIYSELTEDGSAPIKEFQLTYSIMTILIGTPFQDINGRDIFEGDTVSSNKGEFKINYTEDMAAFYLDNHRENFQITADVILDENIKIICGRYDEH